MANYFNTLSLREKLEQLGKCRFMEASEFSDGVEALKGKKIVIVGCGAQGLNQGSAHQPGGQGYEGAEDGEQGTQHGVGDGDAVDTGLGRGEQEGGGGRLAGAACV